MQLFGKMVTWIVTGIEGLLSRREEAFYIPICSMQSKSHVGPAPDFCNRKMAETRPACFFLRG